ncbi:MAG: sugar transferase [Tepidisphaeraceae bacterium]|jgi:lipopolysaccharide/colanic/teichoic acid biosynthesis glycosyltransferase
MSSAQTERITETPADDLMRPPPHHRPKPRRRPHSLKHLHNRADIDAILHRECARCERNGHEVSLVIVSTAPGAPPKQLQRLANLLCRRARATDEIGWFDSKCVCIVLPDTSAAGASEFLEQFVEAAYFHALSPQGRSMTYPSQWQAESLEEDADLGDDHRDVSVLLIKPLPLWKRAIDLALAGFALTLASPILAIAALAIRLSSPGPILFRQKRAGLGGKPFTIFKFRTMCIDAEQKKAALRHRSEQDGPAFKIRHDPRITRVGRFLRETSLDELPQLWNVIRGDMSLVGPRPLPLDESQQCDVWHRRRLDVTPGLTCIWQVKGRSRVTFTEWIRMDRTYIGRRSLWNDLKLILMTVPSVLLRRGAK